jgi:hypothetical protein
MRAHAGDCLDEELSDYLKEVISILIAIASVLEELFIERTRTATMRAAQ